MKLFLTSQGIPVAFRHVFVKLIGKRSIEARVAYIPDAADVYSQNEKRPWFYDAFGDLKATSVQIEEVHLSDYEGNAEKLQSVLKK